MERTENALAAERTAHEPAEEEAARARTKAVAERRRGEVHRSARRSSGRPPSPLSIEQSRRRTPLHPPGTLFILAMERV
ncbi:hypothetical protein GCM10014719_47820 [Planomonospora parontospora subsp. antibiotica]|nr:hypothetical protein GCM10014719_47820 [Planomonospora parontospora subsp. antibiotica]GII17911.1 hypothetical protein Ppa05_46370 [Planomonospora parontospora subsp. antibiotica]